jgi:hypothetical protein
MAYKQPYKGVNKSDGASVPFLAALAPVVKAIGAKVAAKVAAKAALKAGTKAVVKKGAQTVAKKTAEEGAKRLAQEGGKKVIGQVAKRGAVNATQSAMPALQTNVTSSVAKSATKKGLGKVAAKAGEIGKSAIDKGKEVVQKGKDMYDKGAKKVADATGFEVDDVKAGAETLASNAKAKVGEKIAEKKQEGQDAMDAVNAKKTSDLPAASRGDGYAKQGAYEKPEGPNMFEHRKNYGPSIKSRYANSKHGASTTNPATDPNAAANLNASNNDNLLSADPGNLFKNKFGDDMIRSISAPVQVGGVTFDIGDAVRLGVMGGKAISKGIKDRKNIKADKGFQDTKKAIKGDNPGKGLIAKKKEAKKVYKADKSDTNKSSLTVAKNLLKKKRLEKSNIKNKIKNPKK